MACDHIHIIFKISELILHDNVQKMHYWFVHAYFIWFGYIFSFLFCFAIHQFRHAKDYKLFDFGWYSFDIEMF